MRWGAPWTTSSTNRCDFTPETKTPTRSHNPLRPPPPQTAPPGKATPLAQASPPLPLPLPPPLASPPGQVPPVALAPGRTTGPWTVDRPWAPLGQTALPTKLPRRLPPCPPQVASLPGHRRRRGHSKAATGTRRLRQEVLAPRPTRATPLRLLPKPPPVVSRFS